MTDIGFVLGKVSEVLAGHVAPRLSGEYLGGQVSMSAILVSMSAEAFDVAADRLVNEITMMRALLDKGGADPGQVPAAGSVKVSELTVERDALARLLIDLQAELETRDDPDSRELNAQIWAHHMATVMARMPSPPNLAQVGD